ncbi:hypothetical protein GW17_00047862, partial [Ensete ventricosum]
MQGWPPTAKAPYKGAADCGQGQPAREAGIARRGNNPQGRPPPATGVAVADHRGRYPLAGWLPTGKGSRRLRRGSSDGNGDANGARG